MTTRPPSPRYRVVERGRRLEVIDTRDGEPVRPRAPGGLPISSRNPGGAFARLLSRGERTPDGRYVLRTRGEFDARGPRGIALAEGGARLLALVLGGVAILAAAVLAAFAWLGFGGLVVTGVAIGMAMQHGRPAFTRVLDRLGETI
ncbi:hypothetical protein [Sphingomonas sp.]|jgi:hypothetical protein|uniref:hypothetical protein n=1 Tax=Sphingomonas sp. TaxID=28214 RepID=UPI002ED90535